MFPRHPKGAAAIAALAEGLKGDCADLDRLAESVTDPPWAESSGRSAVRRHTDEITRRVRELAASIADYGAAVAAFDEKVDRLNAQWEAQRRNGFGVPPPVVPDDATPAELAAADQEHADRVRRVRQAVTRALRREYDRARADLAVADTAFERATRHRPASGMH